MRRLSVTSRWSTIFSSAFVIAIGVGCDAPAPSGALTVGVIAPLSGDAGAYGESLKNGMLLAAAQINSASTTAEDSVYLLWEDSRAEPKLALAAFEKLTTVDRVRVVVGDMFSGATLAIAPLAQRRGIVLVSPTASAEAVPKVGDHIFSIYPSDSYEGRFVGDQVGRTMKSPLRVAIVFEQADAMIGVKDAFARSLRSRGDTAIHEEAVTPGANDLSSVVASVRAFKPDVVYLALKAPEVAQFLRQGAQQGVRARYFSISTCFDPNIFELAGRAVSGLTFSAPVFEAGSQASSVSSFVSAYESANGAKPDVWAAYGYDVLRIIQLAKLRNGKRLEGLAAQIAATRNFEGATGRTTFNQERGVDKEMRMLSARFETRTFVRVDTASSLR